MKRILLLFGLITIFFSVTFGQLDDFCYYINFDDQYGLQHLTMDTVSNSQNIWQIGYPKKTIFSGGNVISNVIVTDTSKPYPVNDTSVFIITNVVVDGGFVHNHTANLAGEYFVNSDTLNDYGKIELSLDNGRTWVDLLDTSLDYVYWDDEKPILTGNSNQWKFFEINLAHYGYYNGVSEGDTLLYKFTFISDSIQTNKDGLMFDNLFFDDWYEGIEEIGFNFFQSKCFPNPVKNELKISFKNDKKINFELFIYDILGNEIYNTQINLDNVNLSVSEYNKGVYYYKLVNKSNKEYSIGKFIKE